MVGDSEVILLWAIPSWEQWAAAEKAELIETIGEIVLALPQTLGLFGITEFAEADEDNEDDAEDELAE